MKATVNMKTGKDLVTPLAKFEVGEIFIVTGGSRFVVLAQPDQSRGFLGKHLLKSGMTLIADLDDPDGVFGLVHSITEGRSGGMAGGMAISFEEDDS